MSTQRDDGWGLPVPCAVDGVDLKSTGRAWRAVDTAGELIFVCDLHSDTDIRDAIHAAESPDSIYEEVDGA